MMRPYPDCRKCGKGALVHQLVGASLFCWRRDAKDKQEGYFGPGQPYLVAELYKRVYHKKTPKHVVDAVIAAKKEGVEGW